MGSEIQDPAPSGNGCPIYDVICGGIANDRVFNTIELYQDGLISRQEALGKLRYYRPNYQICITSQNLLDEYLIFQCDKEV